MVFSSLFASAQNPFAQNVFSLRIRLKQNSHHAVWFCIVFLNSQWDIPILAKLSLRVQPYSLRFFRYVTIFLVMFSDLPRLSFAR